MRIAGDDLGHATEFALLLVLTPAQQNDLKRLLDKPAGVFLNSAGRKEG